MYFGRGALSMSANASSPRPAAMAARASTMARAYDAKSVQFFLSDGDVISEARPSASASAFFGSARSYASNKPDMPDSDQPDFAGGNSRRRRS